MALSFLSDEPRVNLGSLAPLSGAAALTFSAWVRFAATTGDATVVVRGSTFATSAPLLVWRDEVALVSGRTDTLSALVNTDVGLVRVEAASNLLADTQWRHIAVVFEVGAADGLRVFVDGVRDSNTASTVGHTAIVSDTSEVTLGMNDAARLLTGDMAECGCWSTALTDQDVALLAAGFTPLALGHAVDRLVTYHDLVRSVNRPGVGATATTSGTFGTAAHPRTLWPSCVRAGVAYVRPVVAGPHCLVAGETTGDRRQASTLSISGVDRGAVVPAGEVNS